ncbi:hypothetical protein BT63DRAFT_450509 [Microthyrium microscopicum]|uniref:ABC transporter domain-containing protein n=1 Tax=Microthyrium microscopicum TaxID=703497 RepID=A0A6A6UTR2_9PEZI|nr:hypothetical protein BT63DRAFT_450509 [Microthyrium microscopicum]
MSFLGSGVTNNNDATMERSGAPTTHNARRPSQGAEETETPIGMHRQRSRPTEKTEGGYEDVTRTPDEEDVRRDKEIHGLARKMTQGSSYSEIDNNPLEAGPDSKLNPNSENFNAKAWAKALMNLQARDENNPLRTAGVAYRNMNVYGFGAETDFQKTVSSIWIQAYGSIRTLLGRKQRRIDILRDFEGIVRPGEMLVVLGPPGSGCTTFLKTISGETHGFNVDKDSYINYQGIRAAQMHKNFRGEAIYTAEIDVHFPQLSVKDTLTFAARARAPRHAPGGVTPHVYADHRRDVVMAMYGISHTANTIVGNEYVRGVSGGERKRVTIAEATLSGAPLQCWDNSTRGLDSANAVEFCKTLKINADVMNTAALVSIYQAPQSAFENFDKALVIYEGRQIYFGPCNEALQYFINLGFYCPDRQTVPDFLTSMTSPQERVVREGWESRVPKTPDDFARAWKASAPRAKLVEELDAYDKEYAIDGEYLEKFKQSRRAQQSKRQRVSSPFTLSYVQQVQLCLWRSWQRFKGDPSVTVVQALSNSIMALVISSVFYNLQPDTNSFFQRGAVLFFAILMNAFGSALEILTLYAQRPIVEKHARYALYHPSAEAFASMLMDLPYKVLNAIFFNVVLYFMVNLRREPGPFFFFLLTTFTLTLVMSMLFRFIASVSRSLSQALAPAGILILAIIIYTGFAIPIKNMLGWSRWINYLDPVAYGFESLMVNEFHGRNFSCSNVLPQGPGYDTTPNHKICTVTGSVEGSLKVNGDDYIGQSFAYYHAHKWRNYGIMLAFMIGLMVAYLVAAEFVSEKKSKGEVLVWPRSRLPKRGKDDEENALERVGSVGALKKETTIFEGIQKQTAVFSWKDVCYSVPIKKETRVILDHVDGWVKPGTLTALMGVSGAGKTTLLDALATRTTMGVVTGEMLVDGLQRDTSFQRKTGYVQQQDLHLQTSTVREALNFSALLRQPKHLPRAEKLAYVDEVIKLLDMEEYADAVVGVPGEGLNVEQRKRLTIGVELAAKPELLLFLDEPTSGLDSQTSWAICDLMEKLTKNGQAILCTIHQPSAMLFQRFDRLLFLKRGGQTVYFGEIGENSQTLIKYFERNGGIPCPPDANPAEWMLEVIGAAPGSSSDVDWFQAWRNSPEYEDVQRELQNIKTERPQLMAAKNEKKDKASYSEFAASFTTQMVAVQRRVFQQYWRTPNYIYAKASLCTFSALFIGFSFFKATLSIQGLQNQMFAIFMLFTIFGQLIQQLMPHFVVQRALYEVRERPSKTYSWKAFMLSNIIAELPWQTLMAVIMYFCWYYPVGFYNNAIPTNSVHERGALFFLLIWVFLIFTSTFGHLCIAAIDTAEAGGNIANLMFSLILIFCGVLATPTALPGFWKFMYYVSPFSYLASSMLSVGTANAPVTCLDYEYLMFTPPSGQNCGDYMKAWISSAGGYLQNPAATDTCAFCSISDSNTFLAQVNSRYEDRWRNFGIMWAFVIFNIVGALFLYWLARVPKKSARTVEEAAPAKGAASHMSADKSSDDGLDSRAEISRDPVTPPENKKLEAESTHVFTQFKIMQLDSAIVFTDTPENAALSMSIAHLEHEPADHELSRYQPSLPCIPTVVIYMSSSTSLSLSPPRDRRQVHPNHPTAP